MKNVLVIFQTTHARTESLALAVGLGAVQTGASIRLRHLTPSSAAALEHKGYGTLKESDLLWAEGVVIAVESEIPVTECDEFTSIVHPLEAGNALTGKKAFAFGPEGKGSTDCESVAHLNHVMVGAGMVLIESTVPARETFPDVLEYLNSAGQTLAGL
jgi:hypothetical protein